MYLSLCISAYIRNTFWELVPIMSCGMRRCGRGASKDWISYCHATNRWPFHSDVAPTNLRRSTWRTLKLCLAKLTFFPGGTRTLEFLLKNCPFVYTPLCNNPINYFSSFIWLIEEIALNPLLYSCVCVCVFILSSFCWALGYYFFLTSPRIVVCKQKKV